MKLPHDIQSLRDRVTPVSSPSLWGALTMLRWAWSNTLRVLGLAEPPARHYSLGDYDEEYRRRDVMDAIVVVVVVLAFVSLITIAALSGDLT